jgi:serine/threonine protein kinase
MSSDAERSTILETLLAQCIDRIFRSGDEAVDEVCASHPELAEEVRRSLRDLERAGMFESARPHPPGIPERLGDFRLVERLGGGGMGVVYLAEQTSLGREVALKLGRPELLYFSGARERFAREVEVVARLQHPGIVPVYTVGEQDGVPYFAMERVHGCTLAEVLRHLAGRDPAGLWGHDLARAVAASTPGAETPGEGEELGYVYGGSWERTVLRVVGQIADALEHAQQRGVLHRDIKPSNVMITPGGRAMLLDFGLSSSGGASSITKTGSRLGSLPYMPPEQVGGGGEAIGPASGK